MSFNVTLDDAWRASSHPPGLRLWATGESYEYVIPLWVSGALLDKFCFWVITDGPGQRRGVGLTIDGRLARAVDTHHLTLLLQTVIDQWETLAQPFEEGGLLPEPRSLLFREDEDRQVRALRQSPMMHWVLTEDAVVYSYDRSRYKLERVPEMCNENQESFALKRKEEA